MTPKKGKAVERDSSSPNQSRSSSTASKRKHATAGAEPATPTKKSRFGAAEIISSQSSVVSSSDGVSFKSAEEGEPAGKGLLVNGQAAERSISRNFADMYTFSSKTRPNGVIDLTQSKSPVSKPLNGTRVNGFGLGQGGPKRLVVKNLRTTPKVDPNEYFERKWKEQVSALDALFRGGDVKILLEDLYKSTEHICRQGRGAELFGRLREKCLSYLNDKVRPELAIICVQNPGVEALKAFVESWHLWQKQVQTIRHIYFYLNQIYLIRNHELGDINTVTMHMFRDTIFADNDVRPVVLAATVDLFQLDRQGDHSYSMLLKASVDTFHELEVYASHFDRMLIEASKQWFRQWRQAEAEKEDLPHYVRSCTALLAAEMTRCDTLSLDRQTRTQLSDIFDEIMLQQNYQRLTNEDSVLDMLEQNQDRELEQCWALLSRISQHQLLAPPFAKFIDTEGSLIVFDEKNEPDMVVRLLAFKKKLDRMHVECFQKDDNMGNTLHKSFETFMNRTKKSATNYDTDNAKPGEMIAKHIDLLLRGGARAIPKLAQGTSMGEGENEQEFDDNETEEQSIEQHLADALDLFRFVHGKAVFEAFYKKDLARRLLMGRTQSFDAERSMLARLRNECGANFTHNLESMFKDMDLAREEMKAYNHLLSDKGHKPAVELGVNVLSVAAWPTYPDIPVNLPTSILKSQHDFEQHFKDKHVGRKLTWKPSLAHCQLKARFGRTVKELVVSGFQAIVLLLFNDIPTSETLTYETIKSSTNLPDAEVKRTLQSLACGRYKVLHKTPRGREVTETDMFSFNDKFTDPRFRVKINQIQLKETKEENKETHQRVAADRHYETQAAIVRIMKARKKIGHNELIVEVIKATRSRGVLDQADIKKNIEKLIEKDYMEREDEIRGYSYLA